MTIEVNENLCTLRMQLSTWTLLETRRSMAFPRNSLRAFLQHARRNLAQAVNGDQKLNIVIGNESAG